jgi:hypothetical protein
MLSEYFQSARRVHDLRVGPAGPLVTSFADKLRQDGYAELTARRHLRSAEHLAHWASGVGIVLDGPIEAILDGFDRHVRLTVPRARWASIRSHVSGANSQRRSPLLAAPRGCKSRVPPS